MSTQFSRELICLAAMRQARANFFDRVVDHAETWRRDRGEDDPTRDERKLLRSEGVAQIAEFFFAILEGGVNSPEALRSFFERHNADMSALLETCERGYTRFGLSESRVKSAMFKDHQIDLVVHESSHGVVTFDQRSIGKILTQVMSYESCRTLLILLSGAGLLKRRDFRAVVLISSDGTLESLYKDHLRYIAGAVTPQT